MRGSKKKLIKLAGKALKVASKEVDPSMVKQLYQDKYQKSINDSKAEFEDEDDLIDKLGRKVGKYSLRARIKNSKWVKTGRPSNQAIKWLFAEVFKDPATYKYKHRIMFAGGLYMFEYLNPKYRNTKQLPWFDKYPLVLSLGGVVTNQGIRNIGFNLHLLPPRVRIVVLCQIFEIYKSLYRYNIFFNRTRPVNIKYSDILKATVRYGAGFAIRMYIPARQRQIILFPYNKWYQAVFIPSRGYDGIRAAKLIQEWSKYVQKLGYKANKNIEWRNAI